MSIAFCIPMCMLGMATLAASPQINIPACTQCRNPQSWHQPEPTVLHAAAAPGFIVILGGIVLPDSPVSYVERGHLEKARRTLVRVRGVDNVDEEFQDIIDAARQANQVKRPWRNLVKSQYRCCLPG